MQRVIEFEGITLAYGKRAIFQDFSLQVEKGAKVVVFGKSGLGKSTLLKLILGFVRPEEGKIFFSGKLVGAKTIDWVRRQIAYVDQDVVFGEGKVSEVIKEYFTFRANIKLAPSLGELVRVMQKFELDVKLLEQDVNELSGGERQRLALVVALLLKRPVMLLDEVTASLDPGTKRVVIDKLIGEKELTLVVVTHDQEWNKRRETKLFDFKDKKWKQ